MNLRQKNVFTHIGIPLVRYCNLRVDFLTLRKIKRCYKIIIIANPPFNVKIARMFKRLITEKINNSLQHVPAVALLGPRQVGKTTLALGIAKDRPAVYLDLESPADLAKLQDPIGYLSTQSDKLIILDEIQRMPELFKVLRGLIDQRRQAGKGTGRFLILGSASLDLLKQSSESLAGRIRYFELTGLNVWEVDATTQDTLNQLWMRGGFPESYRASSDTLSYEWREDFIRTYLERDIPQLGPRIPAMTLRRLWTMLAHLQGSLFNGATLAAGLDISNTTLIRYLDLLCDLLLVRRLMPWCSNVGKRLVKSPKVYVRDSGLLHQLLGITKIDDLLSHPVVGGSWEGFVIENLLSILPPHCQPFFYRTSSGAEIDLVLEWPNQERWAIEIKRTSTPKLERGFYEACRTIVPTKKYMIYTGQDTFPLPHDVTAMGVSSFIGELRKIKK